MCSFLGDGTDSGVTMSYPYTGAICWIVQNTKGDCMLVESRLFDLSGRFCFRHSSTTRKHRFFRDFKNAHPWCLVYITKVCLQANNSGPKSPFHATHQTFFFENSLSSWIVGSKTGQPTFWRIRQVTPSHHGRQRGPQERGGEQLFFSDAASRQWPDEAFNLDEFHANITRFKQTNNIKGCMVRESSRKIMIHSDWISRWRFFCSPRCLGRWSYLATWYVSTGWLNHQPDMIFEVCLNPSGFVFQILPPLVPQRLWFTTPFKGHKWVCSFSSL